MSGRRSPPLAVALAVVGGLLLVGATTGNWVMAEQLRRVGGVPLVEPAATPGVGLPAHGVSTGVLAALGGLGLIAARGRGRSVLGALLCLVGTAAVGAVAVGVVRAVGEPGGLTAAPWIAGLGAAATLAAGVAAWRRPTPPPVLGDRYSIDATDDEDDGEWASASDEQ